MNGPKCFSACALFAYGNNTYSTFPARQMIRMKIRRTQRRKRRRRRKKRRKRRRRKTKTRRKSKSFLLALETHMSLQWVLDVVKISQSIEKAL